MEPVRGCEDPCEPGTPGARPDLWIVPRAPEVAPPAAAPVAAGRLLAAVAVTLALAMTLASAVLTAGSPAWAMSLTPTTSQCPMTNAP